MTSITPLQDYIVAQRAAAVTQLPSGFFIPEKAAERPAFASVVSIGAEVRGIEIGVKILYKSYAATDIKLDGTEYILIKSEDVIAVLTEADE